MDALSPAQGLLYGFIQGTTEVLPISSSAHLVLLPWFLEWPDPGLGFDVSLHAGTLLAILWYFGREWWGLGVGVVESLRQGAFAANEDARMFWRIALASVPGAIAGLLLEDVAGTVFRSPLLIAVTLAGFGALLWIADRRPPTRTGVRSIGLRDALIVGTAQAVALVPGVSRSGVTITAARFLGIDRESAARFSFLLATPIIAGATLVKGGSLVEAFTTPGPLAALAAAMIFGFLSIIALLRFVRTRSYTPFVVYRFLLAIVILTAA